MSSAAPWGHRDFRLLTLGSTISALGNAITPVALAYAVLDLGGSATDLGLVVAAYALAEVVTILLGGVLGDRLPRAVLLQGSSLAAGVIEAVTAVALITGWATLPVLGGLSLLGGAVSALAQPASAALTRQTVPESILGQAIALRRLLQNGAMVAGFALAGVLVGGIGSGGAIAVDAATFVLAALCFGRLRVPDVPGAAESAGLLRDLGAGAAEVLRRTWLWLLIGQALLYHLVWGGAQGVLGPIVVGGEFGRAAWGWSLAALMVGFIVGGLVCLRWRPRHALFVGTALLALTALFPLAMAVSDRLALVLLAAAVHGFGLEVFSVGWDLSIQENVPEDRLARVYAFDAVGSFVARPLGLALTGPVAEAVGFHRWLLVVAAVMGGSSLLALLSPDVRRLRRH